MLVVRKCILTLRSNTLDLDITQSELDRIDNRHSTGEYIQDIVPSLSASEREFLMTGILEDVWQGQLPILTEEHFEGNLSLWQDNQLLPPKKNQMSKNLPDDWGSHYRTCSKCGHRFHASSGACFKCLEKHK
jgi:hypothetical protein